MALPKDAIRSANQFGKLIVRRKWEEVVPLLSAALQARLSAKAVADEFSWSQLGPRLRQQWVEQTGESEEMVPELDPPKRFEVFEVEERDPPAGHDPAIEFGWVEVDFQPAEDSEFDACYNCFLAFVDEGGPRIGAYTIELAMG